MGFGSLYSERETGWRTVERTDGFSGCVFVFGEVFGRLLEAQELGRFEDFDEGIDLSLQWLAVEVAGTAVLKAIWVAAAVVVGARMSIMAGWCERECADEAEAEWWLEGQVRGAGGCFWDGECLGVTPFWLRSQRHLQRDFKSGQRRLLRCDDMVV